MKIRRLSGLRVRTVVFALSGAALVWLVVSQSFAAYFADAAPNVALWLHGQQPEALANLADQALSGAAVAAAEDEEYGSNGSDATAGAHAAAAANVPAGIDRAFLSFEALGNGQSVSRPIPPENARTVRNWAVAALANDPLNARALRILGQLAEAGGDDAATKKFMAAAEQLSLHQQAATFWLLRNSAVTGDFNSAVKYADILLRTNSKSGVFVVPMLAKITEDKAGAALVKSLLASNPPWRDQFISALPNNVTDARAPLNLLLALRSDPVPLTAKDIEPYVDLLLAHRLYSLAYYTWLQFLPPDELRHAGFLYNGNFDSDPSGMPFDWQIVQGSGVTIDIVPSPGRSGGRALMVDFQFGRVDYHSVVEMIMLAPGSYRFTAQYRGELLGPRGLKWRVTCAGQSSVLGESPMIVGSTKDWQYLQFAFTVPDKDCQAQYARLDLDARMASEEMVSGSVYFDNLQISRAPKPAAAGG